jgi:hypothetical protein
MVAMGRTLSRKKVDWLMQSGNHFQTQVKWERTEDVEFPYRVIFDQHLWIIRLNDFPDEPLYTLIIDDNEIRSFDDWPSCWSS